MGCDSVVISNLTLLNNISFTQNLIICSETSVMVGNNAYTTSGTYMDTFVTTNGCDSVVTTNLTVLASNTSAQSHIICMGDSVIVGGVVYYYLGLYTNIQTAANGCDSIITVYLSIFPNNINSQYFSICEGDSVLVGNSIYTAAGSYTDTLMGLNGCDSIVNTTITIAPAFLVTIGNNGSILLANPSSLPNYLWSNGDTTTTISPTTNGLYWVVAINSNGCISDTAFFEVEFITTSITDELISENKVLLRITNVICQSIPHRKNTPLFYIYDDGTVEKKIFIE